MNIGIIGSGNMGSALGRLWASAGHQVLFSYAKDPQKLEALAQSVGANGRAGTPSEAAQFGEVVFVGVPYPQLEEALDMAGSLEGKTVITCVSPLQPDFQGMTTGLTSPSPVSAAERVAQLAPGALVVEAFNTTFAEILQSPSRRFGAERPSVFYCGDDAAAKAIAKQLIEECGYEAVDAGALITARTLETLASIWVQMTVVTKTFPNVALKILAR